MNAAEPTNRVKPSENPFRSGRVDALGFRLPGVSVTDIHARLIRSKFRGAIIGPHGHGKSTLMRQLASLPTPQEVGPAAYVQVDAQGANAEEVNALMQQPAGVLYLDGYDLMSKWKRVGLWRRRHVVVTSHRKTALPTLLRCSTSPDLLGELIGELSATTRSLMSEADIQGLYARHTGNIRDALRELYDRVAAGELGG